MSRTFVTLFFILAISTIAVLGQTNFTCPCGRNEVWSACTAHCKSTCANPNPPCPKICVSGCICKPGYEEDRNKRCVPSGCCDWDQ